MALGTSLITCMGTLGLFLALDPILLAIKMETVLQHTRGQPFLFRFSISWESRARGCHRVPGLPVP